jgi:FecR protein
MKISKRVISTLLAGLVITLLTSMAFAQDQDSNDDNPGDDPPGRAADIRNIMGEVSIQPGGVDDWVAAAINRPLTTADKIWTDKASRTELSLGNSALRLSSETSLTLTNLTDQDVQVELDQGTLNLSVRQIYDGEIYEVDTPNMAFTLSRAGNYRFDVDPNGDTTLVTVRDGAGEATGDGPVVSIRSGQQVSFSNGQSMQSQMTGAPAPDGFDDWCRVRDDRETHSESARYVSPDVVGAAELDENGVWSEVPNYGPVWRPTHVDVDWAPYHDGHWIWVDPWGWTWVDDAPWGFAPSHYGRWIYTGGYWGWTPGPRVVNVRAVYAPALVAFVGGSSWGVGVSFGGGAGVGWFPLGFNEPYIPPYHTSRNYFTQVNVTNIHVTNVTVINNYYNNRTTVNNIHYVNRTQPRAFVAVSASAMSSGQSVRRVAVNVPREQIERVSMVRNAPVAPVRNSVLGVNAGRQAVAPPARAMQRQVVTKTAPPPRPIPFAAKQAALARNPGRPLDRQSSQQIRATLPPPPAANRGGNNRGASNDNVIPNNHSAPPRPGSPENPNAPPNPGNMNGNAGANGNNNAPANGGNLNDRNVPRPNNGDVNPRPPAGSPEHPNAPRNPGNVNGNAGANGNNNAPANGGNLNDRNVPRPNNGNTNPRQPAGNDNARPGGADANPVARPNRNQPDVAPGNRDNNRNNNRDNDNDATPRNNNPNTPSANQPRSIPRPPDAGGDRGPRQSTPQRAPDTQPDQSRQPRTPDNTNRNVPPQRQAAPPVQRQQPTPDNANRPVPRPPADSRPAARPDAGTAPQRQVAPAERSVPKPPPAKPPKEEKEKPKDKDRDNK